MVVESRVSLHREMVSQTYREAECSGVSLSLSLSLSLRLRLRIPPSIPSRNFPTFISGVLSFVRGRTRTTATEALPVIALSSSLLHDCPLLLRPPDPLLPRRDRNNEMTRCLHLAVKENRRQIGEERTNGGGGDGEARK